MGKQENETFLGPKKLEIGQVFFINIKNLSGASVSNGYSENTKSGDVDVYSSGGTECKKYLYQYKDNNILIAIKYLGNGFFEEMTTGEIIRTVNPVICLVKDEDIVCGYEIENAKQYTPLYCTDYMFDSSEEELDTRYKYYQKMVDLMKMNIEYPIMLGEIESFEEIDEDTKKTYLKHSDKERMDIISELRDIASIDSQRANEKIASSIELLKVIPTEDVEMAYLENQLFDFKHKSRTRRK